MKTETEALQWWATSSGRIELQIAEDDAASCSHRGSCDDDVRELSRVPYVAEQLAALDPQLLSDELREWGAWDDDERADHEQNLQRILWLACCDIAEGNV